MIPYTAVILLGAFLLFSVQPLIAKAILPWFGGAPAVWTTCMLFFQSALLVGYAYAHVTKRLAARTQAGLHIALLGLTLLLLPILPSPEWKPTGAESPTLRVLGLLLVTVGGPYIMLATTAPLVQDWFRRLVPGRSPYPLYAVSNTGSLLALLSYPFLVEVFLSVDRQARIWSVMYVIFAIGVAWLGVRLARANPPAPPIELESAGLPAQRSDFRGGMRARIAMWFLLTASGSALLLAITNQLTLDVAVIPFLWVVPLALYLTTFIMAFAGWYRRAFWGPMLLLALAAMVVLAVMGASAPILAQLMGGSLGLLAFCMVCHGELVRLAPEPRHLTAFYLAIAAGGAAGGFLVAIVAPAIFPDFWELPILLVATSALFLLSLYRDRSSSLSGGRMPAAWAGLGSILLLSGFAFLFTGRDLSGSKVDTERNFYGVLRVVDQRNGFRQMLHGRIVHGGQWLDEERRGMPTAYYGDSTGVGIAIHHHPLRTSGRPLNVGGIGLGAGTIAALSLPMDTVRFYEINPAVIRMARDWFTFLVDSPGEIEIVLGDGRLALERAVYTDGRRGRYDVLVLDAFSGDAVPVHLLTREASELYWRALTEDGVLAVHITNKHLDLKPVVYGLARDAGKQALVIQRRPPGGPGSEWMLLSSSRAFLDAMAELGHWPAESTEGDRVILWTDRFSNLFRVLR